ncbi:MAG: 2'-5' RNA ligase family protein [Promethearchaeia archaeon]
MKKVHTSAVVIIPPESVWNPIQNIRKKYDRQIRRWMPHINLMYPFVPRSKFDDITPRFKSKCQKLKHFEITLKKVNYFHHRRQNYTLWLDPEPKNRILNLYKTFVDILPQFNDLDRFKGGYTPHLSIGQLRGKGRFKKVFSQIQRKWKPLNFKLEEIYFINRKQQQNSRFMVIKTIPLGLPHDLK